MLNKKRFLLPSVNNITIDIKKGDKNVLVKNLYFSKELEDTKNKIANIHPNRWTKIRKDTNDLEFPFDASKLKDKPISRAFFKLLEIIGDNNINLNTNTFHLAEAPGGFIEAVIYSKKKKNIRDTKHYTFSILGGKKTPVYHKKIVNENDVIILSSKINKGDIYNVSNIKYVIEQLGNKKIKFITCDGGFTENSEFSLKEQLHHKLIFNQIICSIFILEQGGSMVLKIFDIFTELTFDFVYLLSYLFEKVYICKPDTSRPTNSEKYLYCENFQKNKLNDKLKNILKILCSKDIENYKSFIHKSSINKEFLQKIKEINKQLADYQIYSINNVLKINSLDLIIKKSEENFRNWVKKYY